MTYYEQNQELTEETKNYFLNYSSNTEEENEEKALSLIRKYQEIETRKVEEKYNQGKNSKFVLTIIGISLGISILLFFMIYIILVKKIGGLYQKIRK